MEIVGDFIRFRPDQRSFHMVDCSPDLFRGRIPELFREISAENRETIFPEGAGTTHQVFPQPGLRFMESVGRAFRQRGPVQFCAQPDLIQRMTAFMNGTEQRRKRIFRKDTRGDPDVVPAEALGERMGALILPPPREIVADRMEHFIHESQLFLFPVNPLRTFRFRLGSDDLPEQRQEFPAQIGEQSVQLRRGESFFEIVQQRIVNIVIWGKEPGILPPQIQQTFQMRREKVEPGFFPCLRPGAMCGRSGFRQLFHQFGRNFRPFIEIPPQPADQARFDGLGRISGTFLLRGFQTGDEIPGGHLFMDDPGDRRQLADPVRFGIDRHECLLVPIQQCGDVFQIPDDAALLSQMFKSGHSYQTWPLDSK